MFLLFSVFACCVYIRCVYIRCVQVKRCSKHFSLLAKSSSEPLNRTLWMERFQCTRLCVRRGELAPNTQRFNPLSYVLQPLSSRSLCLQKADRHSLDVCTLLAVRLELPEVLCEPPAFVACGALSMLYNPDCNRKRRSLRRRVCVCCAPCAAA